MLRAQDYEHRQMQIHQPHIHNQQSQHPHHHQHHMTSQPHMSQQHIQMQEMPPPHLQGQLLAEHNLHSYGQMEQQQQQQQHQPPIQHQQHFNQVDHEEYEPGHLAPAPQQPHHRSVSQVQHQNLQQQVMHMNDQYEDGCVEAEQVVVEDVVPGEEDEGSYYEENIEDQYPFDGSHNTSRDGPSAHRGNASRLPVDSREFARQVEEEGAFVDDTNIPIDEAIAAHVAAARPQLPSQQQESGHHHHRMDPPEDEPPSLSKQRHQPLEADPSCDPEEDLNIDNGEEYYDEEYYESKDMEKYYAASNEESHSAFSQPSIDNEEEYNDEFNEEGELEVEEEAGEEGDECDMQMVQLMAESPERAFAGTSMPSRRNRNELPPVSPRSPNGEGFSHQSPTMREAHDLLRRNRQRRSLRSSASRTKQQLQQYSSQAVQQEPQDLSPLNEDCTNPASLTSPNTDSESGGTWESGSDFTGSSVWTDNDSNQLNGNDQRSSRRALILQMAKARMKSNKLHGHSASSPQSDIHKPEEEKKIDGFVPGDVDLDLTGDLD